MNIAKAMRRRAIGIWGSTAGRTSLGRRIVFSRVYRSNHWGDSDTLSGPGSSSAETEVILKALPELFGRFSIRSLVDVPCGDVSWFSRVDFKLDSYTGIDIVPDIVAKLKQSPPISGAEFYVGDMVCDKIPKADAVMCRDSFIHLPSRDILSALKNFRSSGSGFLLTNTYPGAENGEIPAGRWRPVDLCAAPFLLPPPVALIDEQSELTPGKMFGVWQIDQLH